MDYRGRNKKPKKDSENNIKGFLTLKRLTNTKQNTKLGLTERIHDKIDKKDTKSLVFKTESFSLWI